MTVSSFCLICYGTRKKNVFVILPLVLHVVLANTEHIGKQAKSWIEHALFVKRKKNNNVLPPESLAALKNSTFIVSQIVPNIEALRRSRNALQFCLFMIV